MNACITRSSETPPSAEDLRDAYDLELHSADNHPVRFGELILQKGEVTTVVLFIRHFFCLYDEDYVRSVTCHLTDSVLETIPNTPGPIQLLIIGCGEPSSIIPYIGETSTPFPIYSDPDGKLYERLHMKRTIENITQPPPYAQSGFWKSVRLAMKRILRRGFKGGPMDQNGGEWIFKGGKCQFVHRMENVSDHLTAEELLKILATGEEKNCDDGVSENDNNIRNL